MPALAVAIALTFTRSAWVGVARGRRAAVHPEGRPAARDPAGRRASLFFLLAPERIAGRFYSMFDLHDPTNRDRVAMLHEGRVDDRGASADGRRPEHGGARSTCSIRDPDAVAKVNPHLHNVPMQIAAERGLPALAIWIWFLVVAATRPVAQARRRAATSSSPPAGSRRSPGCSAPGLFEHNFGDSEFLMLFLVMLTLPFAADRTDLP